VKGKIERKNVTQKLSMCVYIYLKKLSLYFE
jgi:hypothetical protein